MTKIASIGTDFFGGSHFLTGAGGISRFVSITVTNLLLIAGVVLMFVIVTSGLSMVSAAGDVQKFAKAKNSLTAGVIGFIIVVAAWFLTRIIETSTGVNILSRP